MKRFKLIVLLTIFVLSFPLPILADDEVTDSIIQDDFENSDHSAALWEYIGSASLANYEGENVMQLTPPQGGQVGTIWLKQNLDSSFDVRFRYRMVESGDKNGQPGDGADGIVFMFNKKQNLEPIEGGGMGFEEGTGYGVEFDTWNNYGDYDEVAVDIDNSHISLFKDDPKKLAGHQMAYSSIPGVESPTWKYVQIQVRPSTVHVYWGDESDYSDQQLVLDWESTNGELLDETFSGIGFSASTGYYVSRHLIDDIEFILLGESNIQPPTMTLNGGDFIIVEQGQPDNDPGVTVTGNVYMATAPIPSIDLSSVDPGTYTVIYNVDDIAGNPAEPVSRTAVVVDSTALEASVDSGQDGVDIQDIVSRGDISGDGIAQLAEIRYLLRMIKPVSLDSE